MFLIDKILRRNASPWQAACPDVYICNNITAGSRSLASSSIDEDEDDDDWDDDDDDDDDDD